MKVKELPSRSIVWYNNVVLGVVGITLPPIFNDCECQRAEGDPLLRYFDYCLSPQKFSKEQKEFIDQQIEEFLEEDE